MELSQVKTWVVSSDHKARPKNGYHNDPNKLIQNGLWNKFEQFADQHTCTVSETLKPGEYPAESVELVNQYRHLHCDWTDGKPSHEIENVSYLYRKVLRLKPASKEPEVKQQFGEEKHVCYRAVNNHKQIVFATGKTGIGPNTGKESFEGYCYYAETGQFEYSEHWLKEAFEPVEVIRDIPTSPPKSI